MDRACVWIGVLGGSYLQQQEVTDAGIIKKVILDVLGRLRKKADARRRVPLHTRAFLRAVIKAPVSFFSRKLLAMIARALRAVNEALNMRVKLIGIGLPAAWSASITAYRWGNREALNWRRDEGFALYWGATILGWPKHIPPPSPTN
jgi:hypothetical protein